MLHEFIATHRDAIIADTRRRVAARRWPLPSHDELEYGVPLFLTQMSDTLRRETSEGAPQGDEILSAAAVHHGRELLDAGFTVMQVVHGYGDVCQAITEIAMDERAPISTAEFNVLNRCVDVATAEAVTEYSRLTANEKASEESVRALDTAAQTASAEVRRLGGMMHEVRDMLNTALLAFESLKRGTVTVNGRTGAVLGRSLTGLRDFVNSTLADVRMSTGRPHPQVVTVAALLHDIAEASTLHAEYHNVEFVVEPVDPSLTVRVDRQLASSAVMNLLNNAFKFTRPRGRVVLSAERDGDRLLIAVADECGGIPDARGDPFQPFVELRGSDRTGLGLGLSLARKAIRAQGGDISIRNIPGQGCVFTIQLGLLRADEVPAQQGTLLT